MDSNYTTVPPDSNVNLKLFHKQFLKERDSKNDNASRRNSPISAISAAFNPHLLPNTVPPVQPLVPVWSFPNPVKRGSSYTTPQKAHIGSRHRQLLQAHLQPVFHFQTYRTSRCQTLLGPRQSTHSAASPTIRLPTFPLY